MGYKIAIYWHTDDVAEVAPQLDSTQQKAVLILACHTRHNAEVGVNWDVLKETASLVESMDEIDVYKIINGYDFLLEKD